MGKGAPEEKTGGVVRQTDVAIVGCGPVGAMLANLLGLQGIDTVVLEREAAIFDLPRAVHFDDEVMRLLQTVGLAEAMRPLVHVSPGMRFVDAAGRLLLDWSRPLDIGPQGWNVSYRFHQPELEQVLRSGLRRWPCVTLMTCVDVHAAEPDADGVMVRFEDLRSGALAGLRARYVVGCDGARSLVRRLIGASMEDLGFDERWLVVDALLRRPRPDLGDYTLQHCDPIRSATYVRGTGDRRRWEIAVLPDEDTAAITEPASVLRLLSRWVTPDEVTLERAVVYMFHATIASGWRSGRLLIVGDSAHQTPPFLGQGLCAGMRDAGNLAWKLRRVLRGADADSLLDSYETERSPHVREYIDLAVRLGGLINTKAMESVVSRDVLAGNEVARMSSIKPSLGPGLGAGWTGQRGRVAPQPVLADGRRMDDAIGYRFAVVIRDDLVAAAGDLLGGRDIAVVSDAAYGGWLEAMGAIAVVVRPDRYVFGAARDFDELRAALVGI